MSRKPCNKTLLDSKLKFQCIFSQYQRRLNTAHAIQVCIIALLPTTMNFIGLCRFLNVFNARAPSRYPTIILALLTFVYIIKKPAQEIQVVVNFFSPSQHVKCTTFSTSQILGAVNFQQHFPSALTRFAPRKCTVFGVLR